MLVPPLTHSPLPCTSPPHLTPTDELVQRLIDDPDTFLRTTQTLGAESASITDLTAHNVHLQHTWLQSRLHAVLWPTLFATLLVLVTLVCSCWHWRWSRRHKKQLVLQVGGHVSLFGELGRALVVQRVVNTVRGVAARLGPTGPGLWRQNNKAA